MKLLWNAIEPSLITLKVHCFVDHAILEDLHDVGTPYNWTSSSFESVHRRLQLRIQQCTINCEEKIITNFLLHKDMVDKLGREVELFENDSLDRLYSKVTQQGRKARCDIEAGDLDLENNWYVPAASILPYEDMSAEHKDLLATQRLSQRFRKFSQSEMSGVNGGDPNLDYSPSKTSEYTLAGNDEKDGYEKEYSVTTHQDAPKMHARMSSVGSMESVMDTTSAFQDTREEEPVECSPMNAETLERASSQSTSSSQMTERAKRAVARSSTRVRQSEDAGLKEVLKEAIDNGAVSLEQLGEAVANFDLGVSYDNFITGTMRDCKMNMTKAKLLQKQYSNVKESSDSIVRSLTAVVQQEAKAILGMSAALDSMFEHTRDTRRKLLKIEGQVTKANYPTLPEGLRLHASNLTNSWRIEANTPFKVEPWKKNYDLAHISFYFHATNLNELLMGWKALGRSVAKNDHHSMCTDFFRTYLVQACEPPSRIQKYSYRTTGRYKRNIDFTNLPQYVVEPLIGCCLDGMGLGAKELDLNVVDIIRSITSFWEQLGNSDESRKKAFEIRKLQCSRWGPYCRNALARHKHHNYYAIEVPTTSASATEGEDEAMPQ